MAVDWSTYDQYEEIMDEYLPDRGEGETLASQIVTAVTKLVYKWYNDGDVFDNTGYLEGWANDLSSYANWLRTNMPIRLDYILDNVFDCGESQYEDLLLELTELCLDPAFLDWAAKQPKKGTIYDCDGPYKFIDRSEDDDDDEYEYEEEEIWEDDDDDEYE